MQLQEVYIYLLRPSFQNFPKDIIFLDGNVDDLEIKIL